MTGAIGQMRFGGGAALDNAILDPMQGFDADVWVIDQATGKYILVGRFTSVQITVRNATEPYLEFNQRIPRYLDGEIQIGWQLERGLLDTRVLEQTFGFSQMTRELRINRGSRFQLTFELNAPELQNTPGTLINAGNSIGNGEISFNGQVGAPATYAAPDGLTKNGGSPRNQMYNDRVSTGQYMLTYCKIDSFTMGAQAGRSVIANRWEGLAEGIQYVERNNTWAGTSLASSSGAQENLPRTFNTLGAVKTAGKNPVASGNG